MGACASVSRTPRHVASTKGQPVQLEFVKIEPGVFDMGSPAEESHRQPNEEKQEKTIDSPFEISRTEITQKMWFDVMKSNPSFHHKRIHCSEDHQIVELADEKIELCPDLPVETVSWVDVQEFLENYNSIHANDPYFYRLPSEAEWEYAARAGTQTAYSYGDDVSQLHYYGWYNKNSKQQSQPVGKLTPNGHNLFDMHGNIAEWVSDQIKVRFTRKVYRIFRGGSWMRDPHELRSAYRGHTVEVNRTNDIGFRLVREVKAAQRP